MRAPTDAEREWVENWKRVGPEMAAIRRRELREMNDAEALATSDVLLQLAPSAWRADDQASGLVEQQRIFARAQQ